MPPRSAMVAAFLLALTTTAARADDPKPSAEEVRKVTKEAYIYGYPLADNYRIMYAFHVDTKNPEHLKTWNQLHSVARVATPDDTTVQTPNSDTPYSKLGLDLRTEPIVLTVPAMEKDRYFSLQLIDLYTHNYAYVGTRTTGNGGGSYLIAGPDWKGDKPKGVTAVIPTETRLAKVVYRTQLFGPADLENVKKIQAQYKVQPLSEFLGQPAPKPAPAIDFPKPPTVEELKSSLEVFNTVNFVLRFCPTHPSEKELMERFAKIGVGAGKAIDLAKLSPEVKKAMGEGIADAWKEFAELKKKADAREISSGDAFGTREFLKNNYMYRWMGDVLGIYGNSKDEAMYPLYFVDADGKKLDASGGRYTLHFPAGQLPPVNAFWSVTMYGLPSYLLVKNPLDRYLINSPMLDQLKKDKDGGITLYVQHESPGKELESNWLPAPKGPFFLALRLYWPKEEAVSGQWKEPPVKAVK